MKHSELVSLFLALGVVLGTARLLGELARKLNQPAVMGELLAGIVLGPTILGAVAPEVFETIFPSTVGFKTALQGLTVVAITLFLLVAGIEVDLSSIFRQGKLALCVAIGGIALPFAVGFSAGWFGPQVLSAESFGVGTEGSPIVFALFLATTLSISALPVIAKTLMDLNLYRSELGMTVMAAAVLNDLLGWIIFAMLLGMMGSESGAEGVFPIGLTIGLTLAFVVLMLTVGRAVMHRILPFIQAHASWPGGVLGFAVVIALLGAAFTEWIGIHAIFGSFIVGVALGDSAHLQERTRQTLESFVTFIFAPLFFATVGLKIDFLANFDFPLVLFVFVIACVGKLIGCGLAAHWSGMPWRESWAIGAAMNARGAMEIILALLALEANLINERLFVALVVMALATSVIAGPIMQWILRRRKPHRFTDYLSSRRFVPQLDDTHRLAAMETLCRVSGATGLDMEKVIGATIARERLLPTGIGNGIALSHVRLPNLDKPQVAIGLSRQGIDFDSPDGTNCHTICLILTSEFDHGLGLELYRDAAATLLDKSMVGKLDAVNSYTEFLALLAKSRGHGDRENQLAKSVEERTNVLILGATATARALGNPQFDRVDQLVMECTILDIDVEMSRDAFFERVAVELGSLPGESPEEISLSLRNRESQSSTVLTSGIAIPHITLKGETCFAMLVARCKKGVNFGGEAVPTSAIFVLASTADERNFHLKALSAIVQISQALDFATRWLAANDEQALRRLLLEAPRQKAS